MSWSEVKKINSDMSKSVDTLVKEEIALVKNEIRNIKTWHNLKSSQDRQGSFDRDKNGLVLVEVFGKGVLFSAFMEQRDGYNPERSDIIKVEIDDIFFEITGEQGTALAGIIDNLFSIESRLYTAKARASSTSGVVNVKLVENSSETSINNRKIYGECIYRSNGIAFSDKLKITLYSKNSRQIYFKYKYDLY